MHQLDQGFIPFVKTKKSHKVSLHIKIEANKTLESVTAVSASSVGIFITKALHQDMPAPVALLLLGIPISLTLLKLVQNPTQPVTDKIASQDEPNMKVINHFSRICQKINVKLE